MTRSAAFFDVDGTLVGKNVVDYYIYFRKQTLPYVLRPLWTAAFYATKGPYYLALDKLSRTRLNVVFYRNYAGLPAEAVRTQAHGCFEDVIRPNLFAQAPACIAQHHDAGRRTVLVTGSIDFLMQPIASFLGIQDILAPKLIEHEGRFTGDLDGPPVGEEEKARRIKAFAEAEGLDLSTSFAYGDSIADLPMLKAVGNPHVVNPDKALAQTAKQRGWPTLRWSVARNTDSPCRTQAS